MPGPGLGTEDMSENKTEVPALGEQTFWWGSK